LNLPGNACAGDRKTGRCVGMGDVLGVAEQNVTSCWAVHPAEEATTRRHPDNGASVGRAARQEVRADLDVPECHDRFQPP